MSHPKNSWICKQEKTLISSPVLDVVEQKCQSSEDDREFNFYVLRSKDWCNIIPITEDGKIVMVRQYRIGIREKTLEFPGGVADSTDSDFQATAIREMAEETGYVPLPEAQCHYLGWVFPNPAILDNRNHSFIIGPVRKASTQNLDPGEMIEVEEVPLSEIPDRILKGEFQHSLMLNSLLLLMLRNRDSFPLLTLEMDKFSRIQNSQKNQ